MPVPISKQGARPGRKSGASASPTPGEHGACEAFFARCLDEIYRYVYFRIGDEAQAERVTEDVFVRACEEHPSGEPSLGALYRIAHDLTMGRPAGAEPVPTPAGDRQEFGALAHALGALTDAEQQIIILRFIQGLPLEQSAAAAGASLDEARCMQYRALASLTTILTRPEGGAV